MKKQLLSLAALVLMGISTLNAQNQQGRGCGTMDVLQQQLIADPGLAGRMEQIENDMQEWITSHPNGTETVITIPVVFHVLWNTSTQNISDNRILDQLAQLNKDFSRTNADAVNTPSVFQGISVNTNIQFCLAQRDPNGAATTGIIRKQTSTTSFSSNDGVKSNASGGDAAWPAGSYLNIWVCNLGGGLLGYAQFPGGAASTDGVVVLYSSVGGFTYPGTATPYNYGRTATHEVGHWLNLRHIWGDANCGNDQVGDTPTQQTSNFGCPTFPHVTCSNGPNGDMFMNYMDYTDDACMNNFTAGQSTRITSGINTYRASLLTSLGCTPVTGGGCGTPGSLSATSITQTGATLGWAAVATATSYNVQYRVVGAGSWTSTTSTTTSKAITGLVAGSNYEFQVQAVCPSAAGTFSASGTFTTTSTGGGSCNGDPYETNNSKGTAKPIAINTDIYALISSSTDKDWLSFSTTSGATKLKVVLDLLPADYDLRLYNSSGSQIGISQNGGTTTESLISNATTASSYKIQVYGYGGANSTSCYRVRVNTSSANFREMYTADNSGKPLSDISVYPNPAHDKVTLMFNASVAGSSEVKIMDMLGKTVFVQNQESTEGTNTTDLDITNIQKGIYMVQVTNGEEVYNFRFTVEK